MPSRRDAIRTTGTTLVVLLVNGPALGAEPMRVVLKGHDPVAYFTEGRPVMGSPQFMLDWDEQRFYFASGANRDKFMAAPERFAPQFAGYCTGTMARGAKAEADPEAWVIANGRLYLFGHVKFKEQALKDPAWLAEKVATAGDNWRARK